MKKKGIYLLMFAILATFSSCSSGGDNKKEIKPTSTEFTSGELAKYVEFEDSECELTYSEQDGAVPSQTFQLKTTLRKIKSGFEDADYHDIHFTTLLSVAIVNLVDESGSTLVDLDISDQGTVALKKLLAGPEGETAEVTFSGVFHNSKDAPKWFKNASGFTPYLTGDISIESESSVEISAYEINESVESDDAGSSDDQSDNSYSQSDSSDSSDYDALLDSYEEYVDQCIAFMKKAQKGDMDALEEYPELLEKAQEYSKELSRAEGSMTSSQLSRFNKITAKMAKAAM